MAVTKAQKQEILKELTELFKEAKSVAITKYTGTMVNDLNTLRSLMFAKNVKLKVAKKTLIKRAAKDAGYEEEIAPELLEGPIALAFGLDDEISAAKTIKETAKKLDTLGLLGGFMDGKVLSQADITQLADIPPYEVLMARFAGALKAPISNFHGVLNGTMRGFVTTLDAIAKKEQEA